MTTDSLEVEGRKFWRGLALFIFYLITALCDALMVPVILLSGMGGNESARAHFAGGCAVLPLLAVVVSWKTYRKTQSTFIQVIAGLFLVVNAFLVLLLASIFLS
jgi:hypothetical protein